MDKLYIKAGRQPTISQFLLEVFSYNKESYMTSVETYYDEECLKIQCKAGKYRSFNEIFILVKTYYKSITVVKLAKLLLEMKIETDHIKYYSYNMYCNDIHKPVILFTRFKQSNGISNLKGNEKYSWLELYNMVYKG